jgi:hypothetical protein
VECVYHARLGQAWRGFYFRTLLLEDFAGVAKRAIIWRLPRRIIEVVSTGPASAPPLALGHREPLVSNAILEQLL